MKHKINSSKLIKKIEIFKKEISQDKTHVNAKHVDVVAELLTQWATFHAKDPNETKN